MSNNDYNADILKISAMIHLMINSNSSDIQEMPDRPVNFSNQ